MRTERQACFRRRLVKDDDVHRPGRLPSTSAPSARFRLASAGTRHRSHDFAVASRLPTPVRPSRGERLDPPPLGERPGAARRLLQSIQPASTTARSSEPRSTQPERALCVPAWGAVTARASSLNVGIPDTIRALPKQFPNRRLDHRRRTRFPGGLAPCGANPAEVSRARDRTSFRSPGALRRDCSRQKLRPDPIRSNTSCRELVTTSAGEAGAVGCTHAFEHPLRAHLQTPLARRCSARDARLRDRR
jgi:hypothetical protein